MTAPAVSAPSPKPGRDARYVAGVVLTVFVILSQYFVPQDWPATRVVYASVPGDLALVYGLPLIAFLGLVGIEPLRGWAGQLRRATLEGLGWYGVLSLVSFLVLVLLVVIYEVVDPAALQLLERMNPVLTEAAGDPWLWIGLSFLVGACEETIFRGFIFGYWQARAGTWIGPAIGSSVLFAAVHLYYGTTYGAAAPILFPTLFLLGFAFAATYARSGGNLVVIALLHGAYDAVAFYSLVDATAATGLRWGLILAGAAVALVYYVWGAPPPLRPRAYRPDARAPAGGTVL
ncbi:MAG TPA: type II CAAX endopeptidase family protein [Thermoplasmata archaeon]|nr:type II CAAX endopeptidase family protein [Thermoplasmata archaeon]